MFQGSHAINMDAKGRIAIPSKQRETLMSACEGRIVMTAHTENRCVLIYPENEWAKKLPEIQAFPTYSKTALRRQRLLIGYATPWEIDANGRVLIPQTLRDYAGLEKKLLLVGMANKFELWQEESWYASVANFEPDPEEDISQAMKEFSL